MRTIATILSLIFCYTLALCQENWGTPLAFRITASSSYFLCDLGGKDAVGTNDISDLNLEQTRYAFGLGVQFHSGPFSIGTNAFYARLAADDRLTKAGRSIRRLHSITDVLEASVNLEYCIPRNIPVVKNFYFNVGLGVMAFSPMARYEGELIKLRPLGTEGQNYLPGKSRYSHFAPVLPFGFGYKIRFRGGSSLSIDMNMRKSFTDYLDDVSTSYADPIRIEEISGPEAAYLSDPSLEGMGVGNQRGDSKDNDQYFLIGFRYEFPLRMSRSYKQNTSCSFEGKRYQQLPIKPNSKHKNKRFRLFK
ncbi:MAG: hypothetical protein JXR19_04800 [Bacteroidia bacterium]